MIKKTDVYDVSVSFIILHKPHIYICSAKGNKWIKWMSIQMAENNKLTTYKESLKSASSEESTD